MAIIRTEPYSYTPALLQGTPENDELYGGKGADTLVASAGNDLLDGGATEYGMESDVADYRGIASDLLADLRTGTVTSTNKSDRLRTIEVFLAGPGNDSLITDYGLRLIDGGDGNDTLLAVPMEPGSAPPVTLVGGAGNDSVQGRNSNDRLDGGSGNDTLDGGSANDRLVDDGGGGVLRGGQGDDLLHIDAAELPRSNLDGGRGVDRFELVGIAGINSSGAPPLIRIDLAQGRASDAGGQLLFTLQAVEQVTVSGRFSSELRGDARANVLGGETLFGGAGDDLLLQGLQMRGEAGNDWLRAGAASALADGGEGIDRLIVPALQAASQLRIVDAAAGRFSLRLGNADLQVQGVERLLFEDHCLAFGDTALAMARLAYLLWGRAIVDDIVMGPMVLGRLIDAADRGAAPAESAAWALGQLGTLSDAQLAARLAVQVDTGRSVAELTAEMAGSSRAQLLVRLADLPATAAAVRTLGLETQGVLCAYLWPGEALFEPPAAEHGLYTRRSGTTAPDQLFGSAQNEALYADKGADTVLASFGNDTLVGGYGGNNAVFGDGYARDEVDYRAFSEDLRADLELGEVDVGDKSDLLWGFETFRSGAGNDYLKAKGPTLDHNVLWPTSIDGGAGNDTLLGSAATDILAGGSGINRIDAGAGDDWLRVALDSVDNIDGGAGVDTVRLPVNRGEAHWLPPAGPELHSSVIWAAAGGVPRQVELNNVERLLFGDALFAFGSRAIEVARVAFALWSPAIASSAALFGKGIDWYDEERSYGALIDYALSYFTALDNAALAQKLAANVHGQRSAAELLALMPDASAASRALAVRAAADDAANLAAIEAVGFVTGGVPCALMWGPELLFVQPS